MVWGRVGRYKGVGCSCKGVKKQRKRGIESEGGREVAVVMFHTGVRVR